MMNQNSEKSRLLEEIAQLRNRLIKKAETLGEYEFNATNRPNLPSVISSFFLKWFIFCQKFFVTKSGFHLYQRCRVVLY